MWWRGALSWSVPIRYARPNAIPGETPRPLRRISCRSPTSLVLAELVVHELEDRGDRFLGAVALRADRHARVLARAQHQHAHDALAVDLVAILAQRDLARKLGRELDELGCGARVQAELVLDLDGLLRHHSPLSTSRWRTRMSHSPPSRRRSSSTTATERWRPPVQPTQIV